MLNPNDRKIYLDELSPPLGYRLDCAIATTFSLDLLTLLMAPLSMVLFQQNDKNEILSNPVALLEALYQTADRFSVFCQNGRISVPANDTLLYSYLEKTVIGVNAPNPKGVFHPKIWVLRFNSEEDESTAFYRFLCLSRNLTFDHSWDTVLSLEGKLEKNRKLGFSRNRPLTEFIRSLPAMAITRPGKATLETIKIMLKEVPRVKFTIPEGFDPNFQFIPIGIPGYSRFPKINNHSRLLVLSPFVSATVLKNLTNQGRENFIISRLEELTELSTASYDTLRENSRLFFMDNGAERPEEAQHEGEEREAIKFNDSSGLHAKLIISENKNNASVWTGSANATNAAFKGQNVEFLVRLSGLRRNVGINRFLGGEDDRLSFKSMLRPYDKESDQPGVDRIKKRIEEMLENARQIIANAKLKAFVTHGIEGRHDLVLRSSRKKINLSTGISGDCYPITLPNSHATNINKLKRSGQIAFRNITTESLTGFIAFRISARHKGRKEHTSFVINLPISGLPKDRDNQILKRLLSDKNRFIQYLLLILSGDQFRAESAGSIRGTTRNGIHSGWAIGLPVFEEMVRAFSREPEKISRIGKLIDDIKTMDGYEEILPDGFDDIWHAFINACPVEEKR